MFFIFITLSVSLSHLKLSEISTCSVETSQFQALLIIGDDCWKMQADDKPDQQRVFSLPDPARRPPAFLIIPTDREPGTGHVEMHNITHSLNISLLFFRQQ